MNLNNIREGELKLVFDALEDAFNYLEIDYYLLGALARDVWYAQGGKTFRTTKDVDLAILMGSHSEYETVKKYLKEHQNFEDSKANSFMMRSPSGVQVDILPFGAIEINDEVKFEEIGLTNIKTNGFLEVYQSGLEAVVLSTGHQFKVATLPAIVLLKLIAYDDRPEHRSKDARDIGNIILYFFELQADLIYEKHNDLFTGQERSLEEIGAIVIGRELKKIIGNNESLLDRLKRIISDSTQKKEQSNFVRNMVNETEKNVEEIVSLLNAI